MDFIFLLTGLAVGAVATWMIAKNRFANSKGVEQSVFNQLDKEKCLIEQHLEQMRSNNELLKADLKHEQETTRQLSNDLTLWKTNFANLEEKLASQKKELEQLQLQMKEQFENIAHKIVFDNSQRIQQQHKEKLDDILAPLREKIEKFEVRVKESHEERIKEHQSLKEQIVQLATLNKTIGDEAKNLASALKGQAKTQGNWGEIILEKILERSGLVRGREYVVQSSMTNEEGRRLQPDVVIHLPDNKNLVIDSKVSLIAYERYHNTDESLSKDVFVKEHIASLRKHIKDLSSKNYQQLYQINSLDFVLLFIPIESAFALAFENDPELYNEAFDKNIVIVSTSTLLATLKTIASIWRVENHNRNALEIARQSGDLYDKFVGFVQDLIIVGKKIEDSKSAYEESMKKLYTGRGNLVSRVEKIKQMGAKTSKDLPPALIDRTEDFGDLFEVKNES